MTYMHEGGAPFPRHRKELRIGGFTRTATVSVAGASRWASSSERARLPSDSHGPRTNPGVRRKYYLLQRAFRLSLAKSKLYYKRKCLQKEDPIPLLRFVCNSPHVLQSISHPFSANRTKDSVGTAHMAVLSKLGAPCLIIYSPPSSSRSPLHRAPQTTHAETL